MEHHISRKSTPKTGVGKAVVLILPLILGLDLAAQQPGSQPATDYVDLGHSRLVLVRVPAGTFQMGTNLAFKNDLGWTNDVERPVHEVTISRAFWMGRYTVTQGQWVEVMGNNPSYLPGAGPDAPVEQVSFKDVQTFLAKLNASQTRWTVRLPTEAEWEYAARAGTTGEAYGPLLDIAWYGANGKHTTHPVGQRAPNAFGLYDMLGNVWQWCQDWFGPYTDTPVVDPKGEATGDLRVTRGGCWYCDSIHIRAARRNRDLEDHASRTIGFRVVAIPSTGQAGAR